MGTHPLYYSLFNALFIWLHNLGFGCKRNNRQTLEKQSLRVASAINSAYNPLTSGRRICGFYNNLLPVEIDLPPARMQKSDHF
jgi:hypothetical protein